MRFAELDPLAPGNPLGLWPKQIELARAVRHAMSRGELLEIGGFPEICGYDLASKPDQAYKIVARRTGGRSMVIERIEEA